MRLFDGWDDRREANQYHQRENGLGVVGFAFRFAANSAAWRITGLSSDIAFEIASRAGSGSGRKPEIPIKAAARVLGAGSLRMGVKRGSTSAVRFSYWPRAKAV